MNDGTQLQPQPPAADLQGSSEPSVMPHIVLKIHDISHGARIVKLHQLPVTIGRSVHCDVVIEHPGISSTHARLERDAIGLIVLSDAGSKNGIWHEGRRVDQVHASRNASIQLSEVHIEIIVAEILENTVLDQRPPEPSHITASRVLTSVGKLIACYTLVVALHAFRTFAEDWPPERPTLLFGDAFIVWVGILCLTGVLALFNKLHAKRYDATRLHVILTGLITFWGFASTLEPTLVYNLRLPWLRNTLPFAIGVTVILIGLLQIIRTLFVYWPSRRQLLVALAVVVTGVAAQTTYSAFEFAAGSRRIWDENLGQPLIDPAIGAESTRKLLQNLRESVQTVDLYHQEDWEEILAREREAPQ